jgi:hypothetical protein
MDVNKSDEGKYHFMNQKMTWLPMEWPSSTTFFPDTE